MNCFRLALSVVQWSFSPKVKVRVTLGAWVEVGNVSSAWLSKLTSGNLLSNDNDKGGENVSKIKNMNQCSSKILRFYSISYDLSNVVEFFWSLILKD